MNRPNTYHKDPTFNISEVCLILNQPKHKVEICCLMNRIEVKHNSHGRLKFTASNVIELWEQLYKNHELRLKSVDRIVDKFDVRFVEKNLPESMTEIIKNSGGGH